MAELKPSGGMGFGSIGQHLLPDAVVAFVDGELSPAAHGRAAAHLAGCVSCAADVYAQRQARSAIQQASQPDLPLALLTALRAIPQVAQLPIIPNELALSPDGQFVQAQRPHGMDAATNSPSIGPQPSSGFLRFGRGFRS